MDDKAVCNTSKRQRNNHLDLVDRISALPDFILGDILSFLPTKNAVATSILSKRWKSAWVTVRNLDFSHDSSGSFSKERNDMKFIEFVNHVLLLHDVGSLNKFCLAWIIRQSIFLPHVSLWINTAITRNVQELSLTIRRMFDVPSSVFSCVSLRCLRLDECCISLSTSFVVCLPRLNYLKLTRVKIQSEEAFEKLINGCPMLNDLHLLLCRRDFTYIISSTSLRRLLLYCDYDCSLKLETPWLEYLEIGGDYVPKIFVLKSLSSLVTMVTNV